MTGGRAPVARARVAVAATFALDGALFGVWASRVPAVRDAFDFGEGELGLVLLPLAAGAVVFRSGQIRDVLLSVWAARAARSANSSEPSTIASRTASAATALNRRHSGRRASTTSARNSFVESPW